MGTITLMTDFGMSDWFVGTMKAVILGIHPRANVVDITHEIPPGDIRGGAFDHEHRSGISPLRKGWRV
jgi:S-adenosylmethionine hydrolase